MQNLISSLQDHFKLRISGNQDEKYGLYNFSVKPDGDFLPNREQFKAEVMEILEKNSYYLMDDTYLVYRDGDAAFRCIDGDLSEWNIYVGRDQPANRSIICFAKGLPLYTKK